MKAPSMMPTENEGLKIENTLERFAGVEISDAIIFTITPHGFRPTSGISVSNK